MSMTKDFYYEELRKESELTEIELSHIDDEYLYDEYKKSNENHEIMLQELYNDYCKEKH